MVHVGFAVQACTGSLRAYCLQIREDSRVCFSVGRLEYFELFVLNDNELHTQNLPNFLTNGKKFY